MLTSLSGLTSLTFIDFSSQRLYGTLPANITFPKLKYLDLGYNMLQVSAAFGLKHGISHRYMM